MDVNNWTGLRISVAMSLDGEECDVLDHGTCE